MARIRSIKPEFPQSESMGRVSRDARLCFVLLWTISDDGGRLRGNSRMLASLLFPYDDDAKRLIDKWLTELEREHCIKRYSVGSDSYIQIIAWTTHQKIDKPSLSKIPAPPEEPSRILANPRELSSEDQGEDQGGEGNGDSGSALRSAPPTSPPDFDGKNAETLNGKAVVALSLAFELPEDWGFDAEALGFKPAMVLREGEKFRQYWTAGKGSGTRRAVKGWRQTWSNWLEKAAKDAR